MGRDKDILSKLDFSCRETNEIALHLHNVLFSGKLVGEQLNRKGIFDENNIIVKVSDYSKILKSITAQKYKILSKHGMQTDRKDTIGSHHPKV